jgi:uncharacterized protein with PIN domain
MAEMRFIGDVMVGKLARWLRVLGFDVAYSNKLTDDDILRIAAAEDRVVLTRDVAFAARAQRAVRLLFIAHNDWRSQLRQVIDAYGLRDFKTLSRCIECNSRLQEIRKDQVAGRVPPYVYETQERFSFCPSCRRIYWRGTHVTAILKQISVSW